MLELFEEVTRGVTRSKTNNAMVKRKVTKEPTTIYKTFHRKLNNMNPTKNREWTQVFRKGNQFLLHIGRTSCYFCYKPDYKSWMRKVLGILYDKRCIHVVTCDTDTPLLSWDIFFISIIKRNFFLVITPSYKIRFNKTKKQF